MNNEKTEKSNVSRERLRWLINCNISVKMESETFMGQYIDTLLLGKSYFLVLNCNGKAKMVNLENVITILQM